MDRTEMKDGIIHVGELEFTALMRRLIRIHQFRNDSELPGKVVLPDIKEVEGVQIEFPVKEVECATASRKSNTRK